MLSCLSNVLIALICCLFVSSSLLSRAIFRFIYIALFNLSLVGTNHFGHFYLNHLLLPLIQPSGKIVVTASGVHDPASPGGAQGVPATLGDLEGLTRDGPNFSMVDGNEFNADKAYKDSKVSWLVGWLVGTVALLSAS